MKQKSFETIEVATFEIACDGGGGPLGHPKVYLHIDKNTSEVTCPYCSRTYVFKADGKRAGGH